MFTRAKSQCLLPDLPANLLPDLPAQRYMSGDSTDGLSEAIVDTARLMRHDGANFLSELIFKSIYSFQVHPPVFKPIYSSQGHIFHCQGHSSIEVAESAGQNVGGFDGRVERGDPRHGPPHAPQRCEFSSYTSILGDI